MNCWAASGACAVLANRTARWRRDGIGAQRLCCRSTARLRAAVVSMLQIVCRPIARSSPIGRADYEADAKFPRADEYVASGWRRRRASALMANPLAALQCSAASECVEQVARRAAHETMCRPHWHLISHVDDPNHAAARSDSIAPRPRPSPTVGRSGGGSAGGAGRKAANCAPRAP